MKKIILIVALSLSGLVVIAEESSGDPVDTIVGAVQCSNSKDDKCRSAAGTPAACCIVPTIGGDFVKGGILTDNDTTQQEGTSIPGGKQEPAPAVDSDGTR